MLSLLGCTTLYQKKPYFQVPLRGWRIMFWVVLAVTLLPYGLTGMGYAAEAGGGGEGEDQGILTQKPTDPWGKPYQYNYSVFRTPFKLDSQ